MKIQQDVEIEMQQSLNELNEHKSLHSFTSKINQSFKEEKKILLLRNIMGDNFRRWRGA